MAQFSKANNVSDLNWFRLNLTKRKGLEAFRKIIIEKVNEFNKDIDDIDDDDCEFDRQRRRYLFPSNCSNINGYYESIMSTIKFSCWVRCTQDELEETIKLLNDNNIVADASRKSNSGTIRIADENEVNTLRWIIENTPDNLYRVNAISCETKPATLVVQDDVVLMGKLCKMHGKVETDKFYFSVMGTTLFMVISKGLANEIGDLSKDLEDAKKAIAKKKINNDRNWMVLRTSHGLEQSLNEKLNRWKEEKIKSLGEDQKDSVKFETYLPTFVKEVKRGNKKIGDRKALFCPGYLFVNTSITELTDIENELKKSWDNIYITPLLVRETMRKKDYNGKPLIIADNRMRDFQFVVSSNLNNVALEADDYIENEYVKYIGPINAFYHKIGRVLHKANSDELELIFDNLDGLMRYAKGMKIKSSEIRKLTAKELAEAGIKQ